MATPFFCSSNSEQVHPAKIHLQLIQAIQEQFAENVKILTNRNVIMPKVDILKWSTDQHSKYFKIHSENGHPIQDRQNSVSRSPSSFIVRRVRSSVALKEIKSIPKIHDLLKNHKCYLIEHRWTKNVWDTVQLGFFQGTNPQSSADNATTMISNEIKIFFLRQRSQSSRLLSAPHKQKFRTPSFGLKHMQLKLRNLHKS